MRLRATIALVLAGLGFALVGPVTAASAYPVTTCSTLAVSTTSPVVGGEITVSGSNFQAGQTVRLELHTKVYELATVTTSADGSFSTRITLPDGVSGTHRILAVGANSTAAGCPADATINLDIGGSGVGGVATSTAPAGGPSNPGGTAFTGVNILLMLVAAGVLVLLGTMLNRRNAARHSTPSNKY